MLGYIGTTTFISSIGVEYLWPRCIHIHIDARNIYIFDYVDLERLIFLNWFENFVFSIVSKQLAHDRVCLSKNWFFY